jgi:hypothetical protein
MPLCFSFYKIGEQEGRMGWGAPVGGWGKGKNAIIDILS